MTKWIHTLGATTAMLFAASAMADNSDSSASAAAGYAETVAGSDAVIVKVPIDANGLEVRDAAEMRVTGAADNSTSSLESAFASGVSVDTQAVFDVNSDSSTSWGHCGWSNWQGYGNGYNYYTPSYTYYQSTWSYQYNYSQTSYSPWGGYNSYNYYYYQRGSRTYYGNNQGWNYGW